MEHNQNPGLCLFAQPGCEGRTNRGMAKPAIFLSLSDLLEQYSYPCQTQTESLSPGSLFPSGGAGNSSIVDPRASQEFRPVSLATA